MLRHSLAYGFVLVVVTVTAFVNRLLLIRYLLPTLVRGPMLLLC